VAAAATAVLLSAAPAVTARAEAPVGLALVLAVDASGSVDGREYALQIQGLAAAFRDPEVVAAIEAVGEGVAVLVVQWSGAQSQAERIGRVQRLFGGYTAVGAMLDFCAEQFDRAGLDAARRIIDVSGDGADNHGGTPPLVRDAVIARGVTINGLAILSDDPDLAAYYRENVIGGPASFLLTARDYGDFARAIRRKLIDEILGGPVAATMDGVVVDSASAPGHPTVSAGSARAVPAPEEIHERGEGRPSSVAHDDPGA